MTAAAPTPAMTGRIGTHMDNASDELARRRAMPIDAALGLEGLRDAGAALSCHCSCHARRFGQPADDLHGGGTVCPCQQTPEERSATWNDWFAEIDAYWDSEEGRAEQARQREERAAALALAADLGLEVEVESEMVPLVLAGRRGDTGFWFRARHGMWRLHLGDIDGLVIAEGTAEPTLAEAVTLVADHLDRHLRRDGCSHPGLPGAAFCGRCGVRLHPPGP